MASFVPPDEIDDADGFLEVLRIWWTLIFFVKAPSLFPDEDRRFLAWVVPLLKPCFEPDDFANLMALLVPNPDPDQDAPTALDESA